MNLQFVMDYKGEVQLYQEQLDSFLLTAQKLMIAGLLSQNNPNENLNAASENFDGNQFPDGVEKEEVQTMSSELQSNEPHQLSKRATKLDVSNHYLEEVNLKINDMWMKENGQFKCTICGKVTKQLGI